MSRSKAENEDRHSIYVVTELCTGGNIGELDPDVDDWDEIRPPHPILDIVLLYVYNLLIYSMSSSS